MNINWQAIIIDLKGYKPLKKVGVELGINFWTLYRLHDGDMREPKFSVGVKLLNLHEKVIGTRIKQKAQGSQRSPASLPPSPDRH